MKFFFRSAGAGILVGFGVMAMYGLRTIGIITVNHRWHMLRKLI